MPMTPNDRAIMRALEETRDFYKPTPQILPMIMTIIFAIALYFLYTDHILPRIEKNCNALGKSYIGGHCILIPPQS